MQEIEYRPSISPLLSWEFRNPNVSAQLTAFLVALLSFQVTALIYDVMFGMKPRNVARVSNLHMAFLIRRASPRAILANLFRRDWITRMYYGRSIPASASIARDPRRIPSRTVTKFLILLVLVPSVNIAAVALSLRRQKMVTFAEAGFQPMAIGIKKNPASHAVLPHGDACANIPIRAAPGDSSLVKFSFCNAKFRYPAVRMEENATLIITIFRNTSLSVFAHVADTAEMMQYTLTLFSKKTLHYLKLDTLTGSSRLFEATKAQLEARCVATADYETSEQKRQGEFLHLHKASIPCPNASNPTESIDAVLAESAKYVGIIETKHLETAKYLPKEEILKSFHRREDMNFLLRSRKNVSFFALLISCVFVIVLRIILSLVVNNDVDIGLERIVKRRLGFKCCQNMLGAGENVVHYSSMYEVSGVAHFGLPRNDMPAVKALADGVVGGEFGDDSLENWVRQGIKLRKYTANEESE